MPFARAPGRGSVGGAQVRHSLFLVAGLRTPPDERLTASAPALHMSRPAAPALTALWNPAADAFHLRETSPRRSVALAHDPDASRCRNATRRLAGVSLWNRAHTFVTFPGWSGHDPTRSISQVAAVCD